MPSPTPSLKRLSWHRPLTTIVALLAAALLAACGGGIYDDEPGSSSCTQVAQKDWIGADMNDWYFWYRLSPRPNPGAYATANDYFYGLLYTGTDPSFPADRFSRSESTESFNRFFGDGMTMGYGVAVNGLEVSGTSGRPLYVRYVEPASDASVKGVVRGDEVLAVNGRSAAEMILANDFSALSAAQTGERLTLQLRKAGVMRTVVVEAKVFNLTPVSGARVVASPNGRLMGYLMVKDMVSQANAGIDSAFALFRSQGVQDLVVDLRYNGGGLVSVGATLASYIAGGRGFSGSSARTYSALIFSDKRSASNLYFPFETHTNALGVARVYLLTGPRTASASEQVINGLRGVDVEVISVGDVTYGKPVGSQPVSNCGTTYSAINFESANAKNEGRYFDGFAATCAVAEDFTVAPGALNDRLLVSAAHYADNGVCPVLEAASKPQASAEERKAQRRHWVFDEREAMLPR